MPCAAAVALKYGGKKIFRIRPPRKAKNPPPRRTPQAGTGGLLMPRPKFFRGEKLRPRKGLGKGVKLH